MTHTVNYNLNQWDAADPVRREDFNADNAKIDTALGEQAQALSAEAAARAAAVTALANRSRFTKLREFTNTESSSFLEIYLNNIDWSQWDKVHLDVQPTTNGSFYFYTAEPDPTTGHIGSIGFGSYGDSWAPRITFHVGFRADRTLDITCGQYRGPAGATYADLVKMVFSGSVMHAGAKFVLWGEK